MRILNFYFLISILNCFSCKNINSLKKTEKPVLSFSGQIINVGDIKSGIAFSGMFAIKNTGNLKLKIEDISTDCACTVAEITQKEISPGDSVLIHYKINPHTIGFFQQKIIIQNNSDNNPVMFVIRGKTVL